jgi:hypothetical protein
VGDRFDEVPAMPSISIFIGSAEEIVEVIARPPRPVRVQHETIAQGAGQP